MRSIFNRKLELVVSVCLLAMNVFFFNLLVERTRLFRLDLTEGSLYTLSDTTVDLLDNLEEPVNITFYFSSREAQHDWIRPLVDPMKDLLSEYDVEGGNMVKLEFVELDTAGEKAREEAGNKYGVRHFTVPVKTTFESGLKATYFSVVIETNGTYEEKNLGQNFNELCRYVEIGSGKQEGYLELGDIEYLVSKTIHSLTRSFNSVPGALVARDQRAKVTVLLSDKNKLPKELEDLKETIEKVTSAMGRQSEGRLETTFESPLEGKKTREEIIPIARALQKKYGIQPYPAKGENEFFYAAMVIGEGEQSQVFDFGMLGSVRESDLREAIEGAIKRLIPGFLPTVGLAIPTPQPNQMQMMQRQQPPNEFGRLERDLSADYTVERVALTGEDPKIPRKVEVLVLVRPESLSDKAAYALDQFVMRGGRLVVLADPHHLDTARAGMGDLLAVKTWQNDKLLQILAHWGADIQKEVLQDKRAAGVTVPVKLGEIAGQPIIDWQPVLYPMALMFGDDGLKRDHAITASVPLMDFFWASPINIDELPEGITATVLASTSDKASLEPIVPELRKVLDRPYEPPQDAKAYPVMVTLEGVFPSFYADKPIPGLDKPDENEKKDQSPFTGAPLKSSKKTLVTVIADSDFISPMTMRMVGRDEESLNSHMTVLKNAIDFGGPDSMILNIRNRAPAVRGLTHMASMDPEDRKSSAAVAAWLTTLISCGAVLLLALVWFLARAGRRPLALQGVTATTGGEE